MQILALDIAGNPFRWLDIERAITYAACGKIAWTVGRCELVFHGGVNRAGERSRISLHPVIALARSEAMTRHLQPLPLSHDNELLFRRDKSICAYCGERFERRMLTRDHIVPKARGGLDVWSNVVTACWHCNIRKACRTPEEAGMPLLFVPYEPCRFEHFILSGRHILADQMEYLSARLPRYSRMKT
ncbi:MAG: HNH endonuclease [Zoogloeaceae bacterium]|nr:HNH endonuclease [Zoogloeaceae bacterium]